MTDQPKPTPPPKSKDWLPVRQIWFRQATSIPGGEVVTTRKGSDGSQTNLARWQIDYGPAMRMFRMTYLTADPNKEAEIRMYMEGVVASWEPLA